MSNDNNQKLQDSTKQFDKIKVPLTEIDMQFVNMNMARKQRIAEIVDMQFAETLQHFVALTAKKKNIQWNDALFAGVMLEEGKEYASILMFKSEAEANAARNPQPSKPQPSK